MTYKDALRWLDSHNIKNLEAKVVMTKALEKQIPKKCNIWHGQPSCPNCDRLFENLIDVGHLKNPHFCDDCGQALEWSDEE